MKKIRIEFLTLFMFFCGFNILISCSDEVSNENVETNDLTIQRLVNNTEIDNFIDSFYKSNFEYGESIETSDDVTNFVITEVKVNSEISARGYIVTDKSTDKFLYFVDVDRQSNNLTTVDISSNETKIYKEIDKHNDYLSTEKFNFIKIIRDANSGLYERRRFWGWSDWQPMGPCENGHQPVDRVHYVLWLTNTRDYDVIPC